LLALLLALALAAFAVPGSPLRPSAAHAAGCSKLVTKPVFIDTREVTSTKWVKVDQSGNVSYTKTQVTKTANLGRITLKLELCKSGGKWSIYDADATTPHNDLSLTVQGGKVTKIEPASGDFGYAVYLRGVGASKVRLEADRCTAVPKKFTDTALDTLNAITAIPWEVKKQWQAWLLYAANIAIPDSPPQKYYCGRIGPVVNIKINLNDGKPHLAWGTSGRQIRNLRDTWEQPCGGDAYRYCAEIWDETVTLEKP
jgi:hypothetical protein